MCNVVNGIIATVSNAKMQKVKISLSKLNSEAIDENET